MFPSSMSEDVSRNAPRYVFEIQQVLLRHDVPVGADDAMFTVAEGVKRDPDLHANLGRAVRGIIDGEGGRINANELLSLLLMASACPVNRLPSTRMEQAMYETLGFILEAKRPLEESREEVRILGPMIEREAPVAVWEPRILAGTLEEHGVGRSRTIQVVALVGGLATCLFAGLALHRHQAANNIANLNQPAAAQTPPNIAASEGNVGQGGARNVQVRQKEAVSRLQKSGKMEADGKAFATRALGRRDRDSRALSQGIARLTATPSTNGFPTYVNSTTRPKEGVSLPPPTTTSSRGEVTKTTAALATPAERTVASLPPREVVHSGSAGIMAANLISSPTPAYPKAASAAQVEGEVTVNALVGKDGNVLSATVVSGPPMLREAALRAVEKWQYQPYLVSGKPEVVATTAIIDFELGRE